MFHDVKPSATTSKGKAKEEIHWQCGWWEFYPLVEPRPVEWTRSSTLFTAHPTQPLLVARLFSSSKQFTIPSPSPVATSPTSYEPPTIISVSPNDEWLFAYFPGRDEDGTGCLWKKGMQVDAWTIKEWWNFPRGAGVVTASWAGHEREWAVNSEGNPIRLPPRGPATPVSSPTLLLVTQTQQLHVCYVRAYMSSLKFMICSLTQPGITFENQRNSIYDVPGRLGGIKLCSKATIGMGYNESSLLIAMRSQILPSPTIKSPTFNPMDLSVPVNISRQTSPSIDWRSWGEESTIELCEVQFSFDGVLMSLTSNPLPPIYYSNTRLFNLNFICTPPNLLSSEETRPLIPRSDDNDKGRFYLTASFLDFGDYTAAPKSELVLYSISRNLFVPNAKTPTWKSHLESTRSFSSTVLTFVSSSVVSSNNVACIYAGILDTSGTISQTSPGMTEVPVGSVAVLKLPDLQNHGEWESSLIMSSVDRVGKELPLYTAISPNLTLLCTVTSALWATQTSIHALPKQSVKSLESTSKDTNSRSPLSATLASTLRSRRTATDLTHALSLPGTTIDEVVETLYGTLSILEGDHNGLSNMWAWDILGVAVNVYRTRARHAGKPTDRENFTARSKTARDMCSIMACNFAFEDCKEGEGYGLEAVWQLVALSGWVIDFLENLMKECVFFSDMGGTAPSHHGDGSASFITDPKTRSLNSPPLLHLIQPLALANLHGVLTHVKRFRKQLGALSAKGETAQIAKDILIDLVDCSGIDLNLLESILVEVTPDAQALGTDEVRRSLALCHPTSAMDAPLRKVILKLTTSNVLDKPRLFLKASDLADGTSRLSLNDQPNKDADRDVISKGVLLNRGPSFFCLGCGGRSEVGGIIAGHISLGWRAWERMWTSRCICGGLWASGLI